MPLAVFTFLSIALLILGIYWVLVVRPESAEQKTLRRRLGRRPTGETHAASVFKKEQQLSEVPALNTVLRRSGRISDRLKLLIERAGLRWTVGAFLLGSAVAGLGVFEALYLMGMLPVVAVAIGASAAFGPFLFVRYKAEKRMQRFEELFPEAIGLIIRALRAGHAFTTGLAMAADEMSEPVGPEFRVLYDLQNFGMPLEEALKQFAERVPLLDVKFFVTAVLTQRDAGGNLAEVLENLAAVVRDRFKVKRQVRVVTAHARISGLVLMCLPPALAVILVGMSPQQMSLLWTDPLGPKLIVAAVVLQALGIIVIRRLVRIDY